MDTQKGAKSMSSEVLNKIAEQKRSNQIQRQKLQEYFKNKIKNDKELGMELNPEQVYNDISNTYELIFTLWDDVLNWKQIVVYQDEMMKLYRDISNIPNPEKRDPEIETMRKRIEELEEFKKYIIESVSNKTKPPETKPHEGMYR